jgi:hypothetical protein
MPRAGARCAPKRLLAVLCTGLAVVGLASCGSQNQHPLSTAAGPPPIAIPLRVHWLLAGARPLIKVRIGNGPAVPVLLDTGSVGLHIFVSAIGRGRHDGVTLSSRPDTITYADGTVQSGVIARARLTIGRMRTRYPVMIGVIRAVGCVRELPYCPGADGISGEISRSEFGFLGIGLTRAPDGLQNPLLALPRPYARRWAVELTESGGALVLRPRFDVAPLAQFPMRLERPHRGRARAWNDSHIKVCWATVDLRGTACEPTLFDSGSTTMVWYGGLLGRSDTSIDTVFVNPGEDIAAWQPGDSSPFWTFTSGREFSQDTVIALRGGHPQVVAAVQAFLQFEIAYDATRGRIALYPQSAP